MNNKETITIYWAPAPFTTADPSWDLLYATPESIFSSIVRNNTFNGKMTQCPAVKDFLKNTFSFKSNLDDEFDLPMNTLKNIAFNEEEGVPLPTASKLQVRKVRKSSFENHLNIEYNLSWLLFSSEPLMAEFTAPFFPAKSPIEDSLLSPGAYDIGQWFRPYNLDYHVPFYATKFKVKQGDPLFYLRLITDKKIEFKRFQVTPKLAHLAGEFANAPNRYGKFKSLKERYQMANNANMRELILEEIRKNLIN